MSDYEVLNKQKILYFHSNDVDGSKTQISIVLIRATIYISFFFHLTFTNQACLFVGSVLLWLVTLFDLIS
jgi:hypothetical protein